MEQRVLDNKIFAKKAFGNKEAHQDLTRIRYMLDVQPREPAWMCCGFLM